MPLLGLLSFIIQIFFAVHAVKTGRDRYWLYIIIIFPGIGSLVYFFAEYLPEMRNSPRFRKAGTGLGKLIRPGTELRRMQDMVELNDSVRNRLDLAKAYVNAGMFDEAVSMYESCMQGIHSDDPLAMEGLCCAYFFKGDFSKAKKKLLQLRKMRGGRIGDKFDLLLAQSYEESGETEAALEEYDYLKKAFTGEEARCRYALLLKKIGRQEEARNLFQEIIRNVELSPGFHRKNQKQWVNIAKREL